MLGSPFVSATKGRELNPATARRRAVAGRAEAFRVTARILGIEEPEPTRRMSGPGKVHFLRPGFTVNGRTHSGDILRTRPGTGAGRASSDVRAVPERAPWM